MSTRYNRPVNRNRRQNKAHELIAVLGAHKNISYLYTKTLNTFANKVPPNFTEVISTGGLLTEDSAGGLAVNYSLAPQGGQFPISTWSRYSALFREYRIVSIKILTMARTINSGFTLMGLSDTNESTAPTFNGMHQMGSIAVNNSGDSQNQQVLLKWHLANVEEAQWYPVGTDYVPCRFLAFANAASTGSAGTGSNNVTFGVSIYYTLEFRYRAQ